jgi:hypothetical protein
VHENEKRLAIVGFELWWRGLSFHRPVARRALVWYVRRTWQPFRRAIKANPADPFGVADSLAQAVAVSDGRHPLFRLLRRRASRNDAVFQSALWNLVAILAGGDPVLDSSPRYAGAADEDEPTPEDALWKVFGLDELATAQTRFLPRAEISVDTLTTFLRQRDLFDESRLVELVEGSDDETLDRLRVPSKQLAEDLPDFARGASEWMGNDDFAGLKAFAISHSPQDELRWRLAVLLTLLALATLNPDSQIEAFGEAVETETPKARAILQMRAALPQYDKYLRHDWEEQLAALPIKKRDKVLRDMRKFFELNPDVEASLSGA